MLHGYTQSGPLFHAKTRALEKHLQKAFPGAILSYPTGPLRLNPSDVPGFDASNGTDAEDLDAHGWWRRSNTADPPEYVGLEDGLDTIAKVLAVQGPFDGVVGFSQGAAFAGMIASLLKGPSRRQAFEKATSASTMAIPYPACFASLQHPPMKFCVGYSGFAAPGERYRGFYDPYIQTPHCTFIGSLDSVVEESRCRTLVKAFGGESRAKVVYHPGGHFVPSGKPFLDALVEFIRTATLPSEQTQPQEEDAKEMDVPF